uniref:uncharacterized protein LOC100426613 n=1 Tax=Macaca mulatta TaxID=9544 RepID=UPI0010A23D6E|nr:uncharacterized protein LOC100426613 [Macaca mulatta]
MRKPRRAGWESLSRKAPGPSAGLRPSPVTCDTCHFPIFGEGKATLAFAPDKTSRVPSDAGVLSSDPRSNWSPIREFPSANRGLVSQRGWERRVRTKLPPLENHCCGLPCSLNLCRVKAQGSIQLETPSLPSTVGP